MFEQTTVIDGVVLISSSEVTIIVMALLVSLSDASAPSPVPVPSLNVTESIGSDAVLHIERGLASARQAVASRV